MSNHPVVKMKLSLLLRAAQRRRELEQRGNADPSPLPADIGTPFISSKTMVQAWSAIHD